MCHVRRARSTKPTFTPAWSPIDRRSSTSWFSSAHVAPSNSPTRTPVERTNQTPAAKRACRPEEGSAAARWRTSLIESTRSRSTDGPPTSRLLTVSSGFRCTMSRTSGKRNICFRSLNSTVAVRSFPSALTASSNVSRSSRLTSSAARSPSLPKTRRSNWSRVNEPQSLRPRRRPSAARRGARSTAIQPGSPTARRTDT